MLKIEGLRKKYGDFQLNCTMEVPQGRIIGLIGPNGAGKTTIFKSVLGLIRPDGGQAEIFGKPAEKLSAEDRQLCGVALSDSGFSGWLCIRDVTAMMAKLYPEFDRQGFLEKCERFHLPLNKKLKEFSTGMQAKFKVISAISHGAKLLILDEPTTGLDVMARDEVLTLLREFMEDERHAILISSHISSDLESLCDEVYMINEGQIVFHEETHRLLGQYAVLKVDEKQYGEMDKKYLMRVKREPYGYRCLTQERQFYLDNYPGIVVERNGIDELIYMMIKGEGVC